MSISKDLEIKISGDKAAFTEKFYIYQNDRGIELNIRINTYKLLISNGAASLLDGLEGGTCGVIILKPNGQVVGRSGLSITDGAIKFVIDHDLTNDLDDIGMYQVQFHLYDNEDNRITIPPVSFEVKDLIGVIPDTL